MDKYLKIVVIILVCLISCNEDEDTNSDTGDRSEYRFFQDSSISIGEFDFALIANGTNLVFEYYFIADDEPNIADDEYSERIIFEIPPNLNEFSFSASELSNANTFFDKYCFCVIEGSIPIEVGSISGIKIDDTTWEITIDIAFEDFVTQTRTISEQFQLATR